MKKSKRKEFRPLTILQPYQRQSAPMSGKLQCSNFKLALLPLIRCRDWLGAMLNGFSVGKAR
jgi:hypothetical protein